MNHAFCTVALALFLVCGTAHAQPAETKPVETQSAGVASATAEPKVYTAADGTKYRVETFASKLEVPWGMAFSPDGRLFVTERKGRVRVFAADGTTAEKPAFTVAGVEAGNGTTERGLMGIALHPKFAENGYLYLAYGDKAAKDIRVARFIEKGGVITKDIDILTGIATGANHAGCVLRFGPDGKLYIGTGEKFSRDLAQQMDSLNGKVLRVNDDGTVPADNPYAGKNQKPGVRGEIWTLGNRNPQGFDWHPVSGLMFGTEHGPSGEPVDGGKSASGADEFNLIAKGKNYGWPAIYGDAMKEGMVSPLQQWTPGIAPCGGAFVSSDRMFKGWMGSYMVGGLGGLQRNPIGGVYMVKLAEDGLSVVSVDRLVPDLGRIRAVAQGPDGSIYFSTSNKDGRARGAGDKLDDRICRIVAVQ